MGRITLWSGYRQWLQDHIETNQRKGRESPVRLALHQEYYRIHAVPTKWLA